MRLGDLDALKENLFIKFGNQLPNGLLDEIDNAPTVNRLTPNLFILCNGDVITTCGEVVGHVDMEKIEKGGAKE